MDLRRKFALVALVGLAALTLSASPIALQQNPAVTQMPDGTVVVDSLSSPSEFGWRRYTVNADPSLLRPNARYRVSFKCRVAGGGDRARLLVLVRPLSFVRGERDVLGLFVEPTDGEWRSFSVPVDVPDLADYRLQIHSWNRIRAEIRDLTVETRLPLAFVPANAEAPVTPRRAEDLPRGAQEFEVDLPRPETALVLDAADYGASPASADNTAALRKAFAAAKERRAAKLTLAPGVYRLTGDSPLALEGFRDFTFDARGATFVSRRRSGAFMRLARCVRTRLVGFSLDWDWAEDPLASLVRIVRVDAERSFDFEFVDYADFPNRDAAVTIFSAWDPKTRSVGVEGGVTRAFDMGRPASGRVKRDWLDGRTVRVFAAANGLAPGRLYRLQHYYYHMNGFTMDSNEHLRLEDVTVRSTPGHAFVMGGTQRHTLFSRVNIVAPEGDPRRVITCTADHLHVASSRGFIKLEGCEFSLGADDIMNMHDNSGPARYLSRKVLRAVNAPHYGRLPKGARIEVRNADYSPTGFTGTVAEVRPVPGGRRCFDIAFEGDVPQETKGGFVLFNTAYDTRNVIVRNCLFRDNRARGILILARDVTVEGNVFRHQEMGAIKIETGYTLDLWSEGYGVSNVVIRGNLFDNVNPSGAVPGHRERSIYAGVYLKRDPSNETTDYPILRDILIERNVFRDSCGVAAYLSSVQRVTVRDNVLEDPTPRRRNLAYRAQFHLVQAKDVRVVNNVYRPSPNVAAPGVTYDPESCTGVVAAGNRVGEAISDADGLSDEEQELPTRAGDANGEVPKAQGGFTP